MKRPNRSSRGPSARRGSAYARVTTALGATAAGLLLAGCAPSFAELVAHDRFDEAVCAVSLFDQQDRALELLAALRAEFDVAVHVDALPAERVEPLAPTAAVALRTRGALVRVHTDSRYSSGRLTPVLTVVASRADTLLEPRPVDLAGLAWLTSERLPGATTESWGPSGLEQAVDAVQTAGAAASTLMNVATLGLWSLTPFNISPPVSRPSGSVTVEPTEAELAKAAPQATTLLAALERTDEQSFWGSRGATMGADGASLRPGETQSFYAIWPTGTPEQGPIDALFVTLSYESMSPEGPCVMQEGMRIPLGPGPSLEAQLRELFGGRMRRLAELRALPGVRSGMAVAGREYDSP